MLVNILLACAPIATALEAAPPAMFAVNRWAEPTRGILAQHCGRCHLPNLPTTVPRALAVFNLTEEPWYGRLTDDQLDSLLRRIDSIRELPRTDQEIVSSFVRCARDRICPAPGPTEPGGAAGKEGRLK